MTAARLVDQGKRGGYRWSLVTADLDTLLIALYVLIDDHVIPHTRRRPGRPKRLCDAELVCLAVAQVLLGARAEHHWLRLCYGRLGHLFPYLPHQPGYHKPVKAAAPLISQAMLVLAAQCPSWAEQLRLFDPPRCRAGRLGRRSNAPRWPGWPVTASAPRTHAGTGG